MPSSLVRERLPRRPWRQRWITLPVISALATFGLVGAADHAQAAEPACSTSVTVNCTFAGFEIDGDTTPNGALDWTSSAVNTSAAYTNFYDRFNSTSDDIMSMGAKESDQSSWSCTTSKAPGKSDLGGSSYSTGQFAPSAGKAWAGSIWFENTHPGFSDNVQYLFTNFQRYATNGDVHLDVEFNKATSTLSGTCSGLPKRSQGDILITYDTSNGGAQITVDAFKWTCSTTTQQGVVCPSGGSWVEASSLVAGSTFDGTANLSPAQSDPNVTGGAFGEAGIDLTHTIGNLGCGEFGDTYMKTRSAGTSDIANGKAEVKDFTNPTPFNSGLCPSSHLAKAQADETTQNIANQTSESTEGSTQDNSDDAGLTYTQDTSASPLAVNPGDELVYRLAYTNTGAGAASGVTVTDSIPAHTTFVAGSCNPSCVTNGPPVTSVTFNLGGEPPTNGTPIYLYFEVTVDVNASSAGSTTIDNVGHVTATSETGSDSNHVYARTDFEPASSLHKKQADAQPAVQYCNTASGGAAASNAACATVPGSVVASPTFVDTPISVTPGDVVEYKLVYRNDGTAPATGVTVTDAIPSGTTYVASSCSPSCTTTGTPVSGLSWTFSSEPVGNSETMTFEVRLGSTYTNGTVDSVSNYGSFDTDQETGGNSNTVVANVTATGVLGLIKSAAVSGHQITYTIGYFNTGNGSLSNQTITDTIPAGLSFVSCSGGTSCSNQSGTVSWTVGSVAAGTTPSSPAGTVTLVVKNN
jgi:uncharacterized repeat protein (TIGR01451 family)